MAISFQVMLAIFGATLAWIPLMKKNSFVIEMHPGPPEGLTCLGTLKNPVVSSTGKCFG